MAIPTVATRTRYGCTHASRYRGCSAQIGTAVTKSGILLASKEQLVRYTMLLILTASRRHKQSAVAAAA